MQINEKGIHNNDKINEKRNDSVCGRSNDDLSCGLWKER